MRTTFLVIGLLVAITGVAMSSSLGSAKDEAADCESLPKPAPCPNNTATASEQQSRLRRFFFNKASGNCQPFEGCSEFDHNLFATVEECLATCDLFGKGDRMFVNSMLDQLGCSNVFKPPITDQLFTIAEKTAEDMAKIIGQTATASVELAQEFFKPVADVRRDKNGWTLLHHAASAGDSALVKEIVERYGGTLTTTTNDQETALHLAVMKNRLEVVQTLVNLAKTKNQLLDVVNAEQKCGFTALHLAAHVGNLEIVKLLRANGASVRASSLTGKLPLHLAKSTNLVEHLLEDLKTAKELINTADVFGRTPVLYAGLSDGGATSNLSLVRRLQQLGALLPHRDIFGMPPMLVSVATNNVDFVRYLTSLQVNRLHFLKQVSCCGYDRNVVHVAARFNSVDALKLLLDAGASLNLTQLDGQGQSPLCIAQSHRNMEMITFLESKGVESIDCFQSFLSSVNGSSSLALHEAVRRQQLEVVEFLLARAAPIDQQDEFGRSPLDIASTKCSPTNNAIAETILAARIDRLVDRGVSPLQVLEKLGFDDYLAAHRCRDRPAVKNGFVFEITSPCAGAEAKISCQEGFELVGSGVAIYQESGSWEVDAFCKPIVQCEATPSIPNGFLEQGSDDDGSETTMTLSLSCNAGFQLVGSPLLSCTAEGKWIFSGSCEKVVDVESVFAVSHGSFVEGSSKEELKLQCDEGYALQGSETVQQNSDDGKWLINGFCASNGCGEVPTLKNGAVSNGTSAFGARRFAFCQMGYGLTGSRTVECMPDGQWHIATLCKKVQFSRKLMDSVADGDELRVAQLLVIDDADVNGRLQADAYTPLMWATEHGQAEIARLLIDRGARVFLKMESTGLSALHLAAKGGHAELARLLVDEGAYLEDQTATGDTALVLAAYGNHTDIIRFLIEKGANIEAKNENGETARHWAVANGNKEMLGLLHSAGEVLTGCGLSMMPRVANAEPVDESSLNRVGQSAIFTCKSGFILIGSDVILRNRDDSSWIVNGFCAVAQCNGVPVVENGVVSDGSSSLLSKRNFTCKSNYRLVGSGVVECNSNFKWIARGICEEIRCRDEPEVQHGIVSIGPSYVGAERQLTCKTGFDFTGSAQILCGSDGMWIVAGHCQQLHMDCEAIHSADPSLPSGLYKISPPNGPVIVVYCDMTYLGGGWTVFQRRVDGRQDFFLKWADYKKGFGNLSANFWLGNDNIHALTSSGQYAYNLVIALTANDLSTGFALYDGFRVDDEANGYALHYKSFKVNGNNIGDSLNWHNGMKFTTIDNDNDARPSDNCARICQGAWWFASCHSSNLNGIYGSTATWTGVEWHSWHGSESLKRTAMMIRRSFL